MTGMKFGMSVSQMAIPTHGRSVEMMAINVLLDLEKRNSALHFLQFQTDHNHGLRCIRMKPTGSPQFGHVCLLAGFIYLLPQRPG